MLKSGDSLRDYRILARIRSGGMATLYLAERRGAAGFSRPVAVKVIHPHLAEDANVVRLFVEEALLGARLVDPNIARVEELGDADGTLFLVMEYVHGCSLSELQRALGKQDRRLTTTIATYIA